MTARIFQQPKNAMQSGKAGIDDWVLEFERVDPQRPDPLTGWAGSRDTRRQIKLRFGSAEAATAYAERNGLDYVMLPPRVHRLKIQTYADNFK
jgi:ETC complex I subunit conserved region